MRAIVFVILYVFATAVALAQELTRLEPITIVTNSTATLFTAEIASTEAQRERGLMFRQIMPQDRAMLFDFEKPRPVSMWMKNTLISLDMVFVREDGTVAAIAENTVPKSLDTISVQEPVRGVIELAAGTARRIGLHKNDRVYSSVFKTAEN